MIREVTHKVSSSCLKEREIDLKEIISNVVIDRILFELKAPMDSTRSLQKGRIRKREATRYLSPSKQQLPDRSQFVRKSYPHRQSRSKSKTRLRRESIYVARHVNQCIGSNSALSSQIIAACQEENQSASCLASGSLSIRSLPREIEIQETEETRNHAARSIQNETTRSKKPPTRDLSSRIPYFTSANKSLSLGAGSNHTV
ncbi:unnamed protein product [Cylindrotheca closterium]|uniref:Uncharacterized protein n=1 Tax=Cylindrotheca closterium TaxID=2856 RepID=A0AAD2G183_9STRA|nr:unnamed protein product [Cylindrotheca closterium]